MYEGSYHVKDNYCNNLTITIILIIIYTLDEHIDDIRAEVVGDICLKSSSASKNGG